MNLSERIPYEAGFNPVQKSGHIPTKLPPSIEAISSVLTPFKSPVISQLVGQTAPLALIFVLTPFKSPVISQLVALAAAVSLPAF